MRPIEIKKRKKKQVSLGKRWLKNVENVAYDLLGVLPVGVLYFFIFHLPYMRINYNERNQEIELKARKSQEATEAHKEYSFLLFTTT